MPAPDTSTQKLYQVLCQALAERPLSDCADAVDWPSLSPADWHALPALARREGVAPLLYSKLKVEGEKVPSAVMDALAAEYYRTAAQNTLLLGELDRILAALDAAGIPVIVLKGAALAQTLYPDPALRPMNDIDLLIPPQCMGQTLKRLQACGYALEKITYHAVFQGGPGQAVTLEIHWILPGVPLEIGRPFLDDLFTRPAADPQRAAFDFLYLCAHLILQHGNHTSRLIWLYDLHLQVERRTSFAVETEIEPVETEIEPVETEVEQAHSAAVETPLLTTLATHLTWRPALSAALHNLVTRFATPLPPHLQALAVPFPEPSLPDQQRRTRRWMLDAFHALSPVDRLRMAASFFFPSPAYLRWRYHPKPEWLWPLCYPRRWGEMVRDGLPEN